MGFSCVCAWFVSWGVARLLRNLSSSRVPPSFRESLIRGGVLEAVPFLSPVLAVSCFGVSHVSPLWVRGSFLRGPPAFSRPFLLLPTVESLGFGSRASAAAVARVRPFVYTSPTARLPAHRVPPASGGHTYDHVDESLVVPEPNQPTNLCWSHVTSMYGHGTITVDSYYTLHVPTLY